MTGNLNRLKRFFTSGINERLSLSLIIRVGYLCLRLVTVVLLSRLLGPDGYGTYAYWLALASITTVPVKSGLANLLTRFSPTYLSQGRDDLLQGLQKKAVLWASLYSLATILLLWISAQYFPHPPGFQDKALLYTSLLILALPLVETVGGMIRGLHFTNLGQIPDFIARPLLFVVAILILLLISQEAIAPVAALGLHSAAAGLSLLIGLILLLHVSDFESQCASHADTPDKIWLRALLPLSLLGAVTVLNSHADILLLTWLSSTKEVGLYRVAAQGADVASLSLVAVNMSLAPEFSDLFSDGRLRRLQGMLTTGVRFALGFSLLVAAFYVTYGDTVLRLVFGSSYVGSLGSLYILTGAQVANCALGSSALLLNMTGHERTSAVTLFGAAILNIVLNLFLIPTLGAEGAALASLVSLLFWNAILAVHVRRTLGLNTTIITVR